MVTFWTISASVSLVALVWFLCYVFSRGCDPTPDEIARASERARRESQGHVPLGALEAHERRYGILTHGAAKRDAE